MCEMLMFAYSIFFSINNSLLREERVREREKNIQT